MRCQVVVSVWDQNINSRISEVKQYEKTMANKQSQNGREEYWIVEIVYPREELLLMVESRELWTLKLKIRTNQILTLIKIFELVSGKCSKSVTLQENIVSIQQLHLFLPLFFAFSSEVFNGGIKSCFDRVVFQDTVYEEDFSIILRCLQL